MGVFSNVDGQVGVQRLKLFGKQLIGQRVKAVRAPIEPGPFQKVKPAWILLIASVSFMLDHLVMANGHWRAHNLHARQTHSGSAAHNSKPKTDS